MKLLSLLSKIWKFINRRFPDHDFRQMPLFMACLALFFYSCEMNSPLSPVDPLAQNGSHEKNAKSSHHEPRFQLIQKFEQADQHELVLAEVVNPNCNPKPEQDVLQVWEVQLKSPFATHQIRFEFSDSAANQGVTALVEGRRVLLSTGRSIDGATMALICEKVRAKEPNILLGTKDVEASIAKWLSMIAPDCEIAASPGKGFTCVTPMIDPESASDTLAEIRRTMVRSWSRQPYVLTRRLSVAINLAQALQSKDKNQMLGNLCKVVSHADTMELPLALATKRWQNATCAAPVGADQIASANFGLAKAVSEIEFLRQLFERTSKLGTLAVRIPKDAAPTKDLWINLKPGPDVVANLAAESQSLGAKMSASVDGDFDSPKACWHPLFAETDVSMQIARYLDIAGEARGISCVEQHSSNSDVAIRDGGISPSIYLAESITSESEFVIGNGQSKMLRLPAGSYEYEIRGHYEALGWEPAPDTASSKGQISWSAKKPSAVIKQW